MLLQGSVLIGSLLLQSSVRRVLALGVGSELYKSQHPFHSNMRGDAVGEWPKALLNEK